MNQQIIKIKDFLKNIIFPKKCIGCGKIGSFLCDECEFSLSSVDLFCPVCLKPSLTGECCENCKSKTSLDGLVSIWGYKGVVKKGIRLLKFNGVRDVVSEFVELAGKYIYEDVCRFKPFGKFLFSENTVITFVPSSNSRKRKRGYNQAGLIAKKLAEISGKDVVKLLSKIRHTKPQTELGKEDRLKNLEKAYSFIGDFIPKRVVLVDDIMTTGSTLYECNKILKKAGVKEVWAFVLAKS